MPKKTDSEVYYLPHFCAFKEHSTTTKLRVVFDGSGSNKSNGLSLKKSHIVGAGVQTDLFSILNQFRCKPISLSADNAKCTTGQTRCT